MEEAVCGLNWGNISGYQDSAVSKESSSPQNNVLFGYSDDLYTPPEPGDMQEHENTGSQTLPGCSCCRHHQYPIHPIHPLYLMTGTHALTSTVEAVNWSPPVPAVKSDQAIKWSPPVMSTEAVVNSWSPPPAKNISEPLNWSSSPFEANEKTSTSPREATIKNEGSDHQKAQRTLEYISLNRHSSQTIYRETE